MIPPRAEPELRARLSRLAGQPLGAIAAAQGMTPSLPRLLLVRAHDLVRVAVEHLRADPFAFPHARGSGCDECDDAWVSCA